MALNGGVSLAVWMGGCAVELDAARRAHLGPERVAVSEPAASGWQRVADRVRQFLSGDRPSPEPADKSDPPDRRIYAALCESLDRRLVIDIMSGASAGGINGALLAGAITSGRRLHPDFIRNKWLELGDFGHLLQPTTLAAPRALMQGDLFYSKLETTFEELLDQDPEKSDPRVMQYAAEPEIPRLEVTTTDVVGTPVSFDDAWGNKLQARKYDARFSFCEPEHFTAHRLAQAARASASFPLAFEPWLVSATAGALAGFDEPRWVVDGGLLDNAPIEAAMSLIPARISDTEVRRFVCYVNADPIAPPPKTPGADGPTLQAILGYVVTLPRKAPFVNQLRAIERTTRRSRIGAHAGIELLQLEEVALADAAIRLLPSYRERRRMLTLEELLGHPSLADRAVARLGKENELPWVPEDFSPNPSDWRWGIGPAQRVVQLLLDITHKAISATKLEDRDPLIRARAALSRRFQLLALEHRRFLGDADLRREAAKLATGPPQPEEVVRALDEMTAGYDCEVPVHLRAAAEAAFEVREELAAALEDTDDRPARIASALFGEGWDAAGAKLDDERFLHLLVSTLAVEVVRRAFFAEEHIESGQNLLFAQLTPFTPSPVFTDKPFDDSGWASPIDKLTGIEVGHFAGFYRRSWRANDFMWGRLDAGARVVEMLVDSVRAQELASTGKKPWDTLAGALVPDDLDQSQRWLIEEVMNPSLKGAPPEELRAAVAVAIEEDLSIVEPDQGPGVLTRVLCARAAQLEILRHELPIVEAEAGADARLGAGSGPLGLDAEHDIEGAIGKLREGEPLPVRLGREPSELGSSLALRTIAHAALVALAVIRSAKLPLANLIFMLRVALLPMAGAVARAPAYRLGVVVGFWSAALYLGARMLTIDPATPAEVKLLGSRDTILALLALVVVVGVALVAGIRALRPAPGAIGVWRRIVQGFAFVLLLGAGGLAALLMAGSTRTITWPDVIVAPGAHRPPDWALGAAIALLAGPIAGGLLAGGARRALGGFLSRPWGGGVYFGALVVVAVEVGVNCGQVVANAFDDSEAWRAAIAWLALVVAPLTALLYTFLRNPVRRARANVKTRQLARERDQA